MQAASLPPNMSATNIEPVVVAAGELLESPTVGARVVDARDHAPCWADLPIEDDGIDWGSVPGVVGPTWWLFDARVTITGGERARIHCGWDTLVGDFKKQVARETKQQYPAGLQTVVLGDTSWPDDWTLKQFMGAFANGWRELGIVMCHGAPPKRQSLWFHPRRLRNWWPFSQAWTTSMTP